MQGQDDHQGTLLVENEGHGTILKIVQERKRARVERTAHSNSSINGTIELHESVSLRAIEAR